MQRHLGNQARERNSFFYVSDGREAIGHIIARGRTGFEGFDREDRSLGLHPTALAAANAIFDAAASERGAGR